VRCILMVSVKGLAEEIKARDKVTTQGKAQGRAYWQYGKSED
jgi:hypothetical protein